MQNQILGIYGGQIRVSLTQWKDEEFEGQAISEKYLTSLYFTITTFSTVGYGDISATNTSERWFCSFIMVIGVISFSFANGSLGLILTQMDAKKIILQEKIAVLDKIKKYYDLPDEYYIKCKRKYEKNTSTIFRLKEIFIMLSVGKEY